MAMREQLLKAAKMHAEGEHSDVVEAIQKELDTMAAATDRLEMINEHFGDK